MPNPINPVGPQHIDLVSLSKSLGPKPGTGNTAQQSSFSDLFQQSVARVEQFQNDSAELANSFMKGEDHEVHEVVLAAQRAELTFDYFLQVRNKVVQAYQEVMRMQM